MPQVRAESIQHSAVINFFEEYASRCPGAPCLTLGGRSVSYGELDQLASRICLNLRNQGIGPGNLVALYLERSPELGATRPRRRLSLTRISGRVPEDTIRSSFRN
jgi:non-ribosomal peptide synthetase component E (peptide arylation enzyme)